MTLEARRLSLSTRLQTEKAEGEQLARLLTILSSPGQTQGFQEDALTYAEHFQGHVLQLDLAWEPLAAALRPAWRAEAYEVVARLASALAYPAGRREHFSEARSVLQLGLVACRRTGDQRRFALLLNRLGGLVFVHGNYARGYRLWHTGLRTNEESGTPPGPWEPLASFAQIADILGNYASAQHFLETFYGGRQTADKEGEGLAVALFVRGLYARFMRSMDEASADFQHCLSVLLSQKPETLLAPPHQLFLLVVQTELARSRGDYARARQYTDTALELARTFGDRYTFAVLLIDQGMFAWSQGWFEEVSRVFLLLRELEQQAAFPNVAEVNRLLAQQLRARHMALPELPSPLHPPHLLTEREREVLLLLEAGLSNREIAARLVVTTATVKKHLEHIYTRLDVHNRTSALAQARRLHLIP